MKTKIFVCSSSSMDEIKHNEDIETIPFIYKFSDDEMFEDINELTVDAVYNRLRFDKNSNVDILTNSYERVSQYLAKAKEDGYDNAFFILPNRSIVNLDIPVKIAIEDNKNINAVMYQSNEISIPLSYIALYAYETLKNGSSLIDTWNELANLESRSNIFIFTPSIKNERINNFENVFKNGTYQIYKDGKLLKTPDVKKINALEVMLDELKDEISGKKIYPFILSSDKSSKYNEILYNALLEINDDINKNSFDKIRIFNLPIYFGIKCGINSIAIGYIETKEGIIIEKK